MLVDTGDRGTGRHIPVKLTPGIRLGLQDDQDRVPGPVLTEASMTLPDRLPRPELRWQITPCTPCPKTANRPLNQRAMNRIGLPIAPFSGGSDGSIRAHISSERTAVRDISP